MPRLISIVRYLLGIVLFLSAFFVIQIGRFIAAGEHTEANSILGVTLGVVAVQFAMVGYLIVRKLPYEKPFAAASRALLILFVAGSLVNLLWAVTQAYSSASTGEKWFSFAVAATGLANLLVHVHMSRAKQKDPQSSRG